MVEKTVSRYSGAFSIMGKCTREYLMNKFISVRAVLYLLSTQCIVYVRRCAAAELSEPMTFVQRSVSRGRPTLEL